MQSDELVRQLKQENEQLQFELKDLNYLIQMKEEELEQLYLAAKKVSLLQSNLDQNLYEVEQLKHKMADFQQKATGATRRAESLEEEMVQSIKIETACYEMKEQLSSTRAELADLYEQTAVVTSLYHQVKDLKSTIAALESNLEIALLDNGFLKEEINRFKAPVQSDTESSDNIN